MLANYITYSRVLLILPVIYLTGQEKTEYNVIALLIFILASLTDYLDGYIARKTNTQSPMGGLLDLLADKLLICVTLVWLIHLNNSLLFLIPVILILSREIIITSVRQFLVKENGQNKLKVSFFGKGKTVFQLVAISFIIISPNFGPIFYILSLVLLWFSALITFFSLYLYLRSWKTFFI